MASPSRVYWDANVFVSYLNETAGRAPLIESLLDSATKGDLEIVTSTISIAEVAYISTEQEIDPASEAKIAAFWGPPVKLAEFYSLIAARAAELIRAANVTGSRLTPLDAIHLSTAERSKVTAFHTYDRSLEKYASVVGFPIREPDQIPMQTVLTLEGADAEET